MEEAGREVPVGGNRLVSLPKSLFALDVEIRVHVSAPISGETKWVTRALLSCILEA